MNVQDISRTSDAEKNCFLYTAGIQSDHRRTSIRLATRPNELTAIYRFRYRIYIDMMNVSQFYANHAKRTIEDPLDDGAYNFYALQGTTVVGALRFNLPRDSNVSYYETFLDMHSVGCFHPNRTSISTRLIVDPALRGTNTALRLCQTGFMYGLLNNIRYNFVDCDENMTRFFERLGYIVQGQAEHPEYGIGNVMRLDLLDRAYLSEISSPLLALRETFAVSKPAIAAYA